MKNRIVNLAGTYAILACSGLLAASADQPISPAVSGGIFIPFAIAYLSRRWAIGGWLFFFYLQLYLSFLFSLILVPQILENINPSQWDEPLLYVMFFLSVIPVIVVAIVEIIAATRLLFHRNEKNLKFLRITLLWLAAISGVTVWIDFSYFSDDPAIIFDVMTFAFSVIWVMYFFKARRIRIVFIDKNWTYTPYSERRALTQEDRRKLRKRALIAGLVVFISLLIMIGSVLQQEGAEPDIGIFWIPLFYAVIAAIIAWYFPIRKKNKETDSDQVAQNE